MSSPIESSISESSASESSKSKSTCSKLGAIAPLKRYHARTNRFTLDDPNAGRFFSLFYKKYIANHATIAQTYNISKLTFTEFKDDSFPGGTLCEIRFNNIDLCIYMDARLVVIFRALTFQISASDMYPKRAGKNINVFVHTVCYLVGKQLAATSDPNLFQVDKDAVSTAGITDAVRTAGMSVKEILAHRQPEALASSHRQPKALASSLDTILTSIAALQEMYDNDHNSLIRVGDKGQNLIKPEAKKHTDYIISWMKDKVNDLAGITIDHINCDKYDNTPCNLREASNSEQSHNKFPTGVYNRTTFLIKLLKKYYEAGTLKDIFLSGEWTEENKTKLKNLFARGIYRSQLVPS